MCGIILPVLIKFFFFSASPRRECLGGPEQQPSIYLITWLPVEGRDDVGPLFYFLLRQVTGEHQPFPPCLPPRPRILPKIAIT